MYIKLTFGYEGFSISDIVSTLTARLLSEPEVIDELPRDAKADQYSERLKSLFGRQPVCAGYFHDCKNLSKEEIEGALKAFREHYHNFKEGFPAAASIGPRPEENEIIVNLRIAVNNVRLKPEERQPLLHKESADTMNELLDRYTY